MSFFHAFDAVPLTAFLVASCLLFLLAIETGFRVGRSRRELPNRENEASSGTVVAAALGLLGFMLAFTFGMAASRFAERRQFVLDEANAIGTAYLRARLVPEPQSAESQELLRQYVDARLLGAKDPADLTRLRTEEAIESAVAASEKLHGELWARVETLARDDPHSIVAGIFAESLNAVIDLHSVRVQAALRHRIPPIIWIVLYALACLSMLALGFHGGLASPRRSMGTSVLTLAFVLVLMLIIDLDRGQEGFLQIAQDPLFEVRSSMEDESR